MNATKNSDFIYEGETMPASARVEPAKAWVADGQLTIEGKSKWIRIPLIDIVDAELYRAAGMTVLQIRHPAGVIHTAVVRLLIGGTFAIVNVARTRELKAQLTRVR